MTFSAFLKKALLIDLFQGLWITLKYAFSKPVTERYPKQRPHVEERFRGEPRMMVDENGKSLCIACNLCVQICPENCISLVRDKDPETKKFVAKEYYFDMRRCLFCGFCQEVCPTNCVRLTREFELARYDVNEFRLDLRTLEKGTEKTLYKK